MSSNRTVGSRERVRPAGNLTLSGHRWVSQFRGENRLHDLRQPFRGHAEAFIGALRAAGATVKINATFRHPRRAYLMHWCWKISKNRVSPEDVPAMDGVSISWKHYDKDHKYSNDQSIEAARAMARAFQMERLGVAPSLVSRHTLGFGIDMTITWNGALALVRHRSLTMNLISKAVVVMLCLIVDSVKAAEEGLPADVTKYVEQREGCDHFRGEVPDPPDAQRMKEIEQETRKLCTGTDKKLGKLKRKYAKNQAVLKRLNEFEETIEAAPSENRS